MQYTKVEIHNIQILQALLNHVISWSGCTWWTAYSAQVCLIVWHFLLLQVDVHHTLHRLPRVPEAIESVSETSATALKGTHTCSSLLWVVNISKTCTCVSPLQLKQLTQKYVCALFTSLFIFDRSVFSTGHFCWEKLKNVAACKR